ncbi:MAG: sensor histidine kinase [Gulosibacter sp.]|uniref:sensor histidine kinase n=1 Tax=Gulosibacter sp. TaxID=2817531 RepID=UPI003F8E5986
MTQVTTESPRAKRPPMTLRKKLVLSFIGLVSLFALVVGTISVTALHRNQLERLDERLEQTLHTQFNSPPGGNMAEEGPESRIGSLFVLVVNGEILRAEYTGAEGEVTDLTEAQILAVLEAASSTPATVSVDGLGSMRVQAAEVTGIGVDEGMLVAGLENDDVQSTTWNLVVIYLIVTVGAILLFAALASQFVRRALRPLDRVAATAAQVSARPMSDGKVSIPERVPEADTDARTEVGQVGSALNELIGSVEQALVAREHSEQRLRQFVADASHELRTPLAAIRGYSELASRDGSEHLGDTQRHSLERINSASVRMSGLVEDLLLLARLDAGQQLRLEPADLTRTALDALEDARASHPDHEWVLEALPEELPILADASRIHQVIANLLRNAGVHTPAGTRVTLRTRRIDDAFEVQVEDDGPGIDPEILPSIFERFVRGDTARGRGEGGSATTSSTGLGLSICHAIVAAHGGTLTVSSIPGSTVFTMRLPVKRAK